jgi:hypothetical protein
MARKYHIWATLLLMLWSTGFTMAAQPTSLSDTKRNVDKSDYLQSNSLYPERPPLLVIDGVLSEKGLLLTTKDMPIDSIVYLFVSNNPIITIDDINEVNMSHGIIPSFCRGDIYALILKTKKESAVQDIILDGKFAHMKKAVYLGSFADGDTQYLRKCLKKEWKLKNDITSITFYREGKTICDKKNREHTVRIEITTE